MLFEISSKHFPGYECRLSYLRCFKRISSIRLSSFSCNRLLSFIKYSSTAMVEDSERSAEGLAFMVKVFLLGRGEGWRHHFQIARRTIYWSTSGFAYSSIVWPNKISLATLVLRKGISTSLLDSLNSTNLVNSFSKPFLPRPVIRNIKLLDLLDDMVWFWCICAFVTRWKEMVRNGLYIVKILLFPRQVT